MTRAKAKQPLESFDPRMIQLLLQGTRKRIVLSFPPEKGGKPLAHEFQRRLHTLRERMRTEKHEYAGMVMKCITRLFWGSKAVKMGLVAEASGPMPDIDALIKWRGDLKGTLGAWLILEPVDARFSEILEGISVPNFELEPQEPDPPKPGNIDDLLNSLDLNGEGKK